MPEGQKFNKPFRDSKTPAKKKFSVFVKTDNKRGYKRVNFGDSSMQDFRQHKDQKRRASYLARAKGIKDKQGNLTYLNKESPNYWSVRFLWDGP